MLEFKRITEYEAGVAFSLLFQSFAGLWNDELEEKIKRYDEEIFANPDMVGACAFITTFDGKEIGMASWDPRQGPEVGVIGYNCILPEYQGRGFGKAQLEEVLGRLKKQGVKKAIVTTGEHPFFASADKMYLSCGFKEIRRYSEGRGPRHGSIDYELELETESQETKRRSHIPIDDIVEIDRLNMADFIEALGGKYDPERRRRALKEEIEKGAIFILANRANNLAGYIEYWLERGNIVNVASIQILPKFRNGSVLCELLSQAYIQLRKNPPAKAITSVHANNRLSQKLNNMLGFETIREEEDRLHFRADGVDLMNSLARFFSKERL